MSVELPSEPRELEAAAAEVLSDDVYGFVAGGADDELAVAANEAAFSDTVLYPRVLARASDPDPRVRVLGCELAAPVLVAPMGMQQLIHPAGELATARAAARHGLGFTLATGSSVAMEEVAEHAGPARLFQLYLLRDRAVSRDLAERAIAAGYRAILLTADVPVVGRRPRDHRSPSDRPAGVRNANFEPYATVDAGYHAYVSQIEADLGWEDLSWLVDLAGSVPVVVKGVLTAEDARLAIELGAAGVVVSNHGGRQLGRAPATLDVLPAIAEAVGDRGTVLLDGGVRHAADVLTATALGAGAVLIGRPVLWALALGGEDAVGRFLRTLIDDLVRTMTLLGAGSLGDLTPDRVGRRTGTSHRCGPSPAAP